MSLRSRLVLATGGLTVFTLGIAFVLVFASVTQSQELNLDRALLFEAQREAAVVATHDPNAIVLADGPGPTANGTGPLTKYAAVFGMDGTLRSKTSTWTVELPKEALARTPGQCFDTHVGTARLRAVVVPVPGPGRSRLLLGAPRADIDGDATFLAHAMVVAFALAAGWSILVANWIVRRLTQGHSEIAGVLRKVAAGDLGARVRSSTRDPELSRLANDVNETVERLGLLLESQQLFIAHAAHELRLPLTTLYGELSYALTKEHDADGYKRIVEEAFDSARRLKQLVEDLLSLARAGARRSSETDLDAVTLVERAVAQVRWAAKGRRVDVTVEGSSAALDGDEHALVRMFRNVLENAVRYSPEGGSVRVVTEVLDGDLTVTVSDEGPGIPQEDREHVFTPFFRGRATRSEDDSGTGLGLAIAREIARHHGGEITLVDTDLPGSTFVFRLPYPSAAPRSSDRDAPDSATAPRERRRRAATA